MKKIIILAGFFALASITSLNAQVTIGTNQEPDKDAVLELITPENNKGFLPPRIPLVAPHNPSPLSTHVPGMVVYNTTILKDSLQKGLYVNNGTQWVQINQTPYLSPVWFYMPSFPIATSKAGTFNIDLWSEYNRQFNNLATGSIIASSDAAALKPLPKVYAANELNYYVTGYDNTVFSGLTITPSGVLNYTITDAGVANVSDSTYMNIVFVVK